MKRRKALLAVAGVLLLFGLVSFGALWFSWQNTEGAFAPTLTGWMFLLAAAGFIIGGGAMLIYNISKYRNQQWLMENGKQYRTLIFDVERDVKSQLTGNTSYHVRASGQSGADKRDFFHTYRGVTPFFDKGNTVWTYVDPENSENYFIDDKVISQSNR